MSSRIYLALFVLLATPVFLEAQWADVIGGANNDILIDAVPVKGGGYLAVGYTTNNSAGLEDGWLVKLDAKGKVVWQKTYGGADKDFFRSIQAMSDGSYIIAGSTLTWASGAQDVWLLKVNSGGAVVWQKTFGIKTSSFFDYKFYVSKTAKTAKGEVLICGNVSHTYESVTVDHIWCGLLKPTGAFVWTRLMDCDRGSENPLSTSVSSIRPTRDGGAVLVGSTSPYEDSGDENWDIWLAKLDSAGGLVWAKGYDQYADDDGDDVAETQEGDFLVIGDAGPDWKNKNIVAMKTDPEGAVLWQKQYGTATEDGACALVLPKEGGSFLACMSKFGYGTWTGWGLRLNTDGKILWQFLFRWKAGSATYWEAIAQNVLEAADGGYIIAGYTSSKGSLWYNDGYILRMLSNGRVCAKISKSAGAKVYPSGLSAVDVNLGSAGLTFAVKNTKATVISQKIASADQCL